MQNRSEQLKYKPRGKEKWAPFNPFKDYEKGIEDKKETIDKSINNYKEYYFD